MTLTELRPGPTESPCKFCTWGRTSLCVIPGPGEKQGAGFNEYNDLLSQIRKIVKDVIARRSWELTTAFIQCKCGYAWHTLSNFALSLVQEGCEETKWGPAKSYQDDPP